jgi:DNA-binding transcriptional regulator YhcF (GntR family)
MLAHSTPGPEANPFALDAESEIPVGVQLAWRLRTLILTGRLAPNDALPSVRRLAGWADVNPNTVRAVYDSLQAEGLIEARQGKGTFVAPDASARPELEAIAMEAVRKGQESGTAPRDLAIAVMACADLLSTEPEEPPADVESGNAEIADPDAETLEIRRELRRQIAQLESELAPYVRDLDPGEMPTTPAWSEGHIANVEELEKVRDVLFAKLFKAREAAISRAKTEIEQRSQERTPRTPGPLARAMSWWRETM